MFYFCGSGNSVSDCYQNDALKVKPNCSCLWPSAGQMAQLSSIDLSSAFMVDFVYELQITSYNMWSRTRGITVASEWFEIDTARPTYGNFWSVLHHTVFYFHFINGDSIAPFINFPCHLLFCDVSTKVQNVVC